MGGFIRNYTDLMVDDIPIVIIYVCALFTGPLHRIDYFNQIGKYIKYNNTNNQRIINNDHNDCNTAYGSTLIDPSINKKYIWKFKITKSTTRSHDMYLGIDQYSSSWTDDDFSAKKHSINYSYGWNGKKYSHKTGGWGQEYHCEYNKDDIVSMKLDFSRQSIYGKLSFSVNTNDEGTKKKKIKYKTAFKNIPKDVDYKMAVSLHGGLNIELIDCLFCDYITIKKDILNPKLPQRMSKKSNAGTMEMKKET